MLAVDIAEREIDIAARKRARRNITYRAAGVLDVTPERDGLFDVVLSVNTLFNLFPDHDPDDVLRHVRSLVAPGDTAVIVDVVSACSRSALQHRWWGAQDAIRTFGRRRSAFAAWTVLRLRQHPVWLRHVRANRSLTRDAFHARYSAILPGARFNDRLDPFLCGIHWRNTIDRALLLPGGDQLVRTPVGGLTGYTVLASAVRHTSCADRLRQQSSVRTARPRDGLWRSSLDLIS